LHTANVIDVFITSPRRSSRSSTPSWDRSHDQGFTFTDRLIVIVIVGVLAIMAGAAAAWLVSDTENSACRSDGNDLASASEAFFARRVGSVIPDAGGPDGYEQTLVDEGFLRSTSQYYDLDALGRLALVGPPCDN
jgi:Tfp pilus assembly protein FimT